MLTNIPNLLTLARLLLLIPICLLLSGGIFAHAVAFTLYLVAAVTDYLDGWWARKYNAGSELGRMLDPIVDKVFVAGILIMLAANGSLGFWGLVCAIIILAREFLIAGAREYAISKGQVIHVTKLAKWKTTLQMVALGLLIMPVPLFQMIGGLLLLLATVLTVVTGIEYLRGLKFE